jgi:dipeptidyl aminopeptidase/acylaminoacyl peptidase
LLPWAVAAAALIAVAVIGWSAGSVPISPAADQVTFRIAYPPGIPLAPGMRPMLSPDERQIALIARNGEIWIHELATGRWISMRAEGARSAAIWSPDGRSIAYHSGTEALHVLDLASGASRRITSLGTISDGSSGDWCQSGNIVITKDRNSALLSIPAAGGSVTNLAEIDPARGEVSFGRPQCLPSGRLAVLIRSASGPFLTRIGDESTFAARSGPDLPGLWTWIDELHGFFNNEGTLLYQEFDRQHRPVGDPEVVVRDIGTVQGNPLVSAGHHAIVYRSTEPENQRQFAWFDRHGLQVGLVDLAGGARNPQLSGDGKLLAFESFQGTTSRRDIHVLRFADGQRQQIMNSGIDNADAQWSANTGQLLFGRGSEGRQNFLIRDLASTTERPIAAIAAASSQWPTDWSSDGTKVLFSENNLACVVAGLNGGEPKTPIRYSGAVKCQFSPNGKYISYVDAGIGTVVVEPLPPNGARWQISSESASEPRWHPNGKELFFLDVDQMLMSSEINLEPEFKAGPPRPLFRTRIPTPMRTGVAFNYDVAPDGRFLINTVKPGTEPPALHVILNWRPQGASAGSR